MTHYLRWDPGIRVGVEEIDLEHQTFVALINQLDEHRDSPEMKQRILQALAKYAAFHFQSEENIMFAAAYPGIDAHRLLHLALLEHLNIVSHKLRCGEMSYGQALNFLQEWYCNHTSKEDLKFAEFLRLQRET